MSGRSLFTQTLWRRIGGVAVLWIAAGFGMGACAPLPEVALPGPPGSAAALAGEWDGSYVGPATGRTGSIWFKLVDGEDHAHGDVLMKPQGASAPYARYAPPSIGRESRTPASTMLTIHLVRVMGNQVDGILDPYWDDACECEALTTFSGVIFENRITGTFVTRLAGDMLSTGRWEVTRRRPSQK
jgi:hypothetical protein